jgi:2-(1,2-epoxy-1,2-dihydrophenyl)acetyl-CoA isomerase
LPTAKLGVPVALDLLLTGGTMDAAEACRLGLTRRVVARARLDEDARALAGELAALPPEALALTKALCRGWWTDRLDALLAHEADAFALATLGPGHLEAVDALRRKARPRTDPPG